MGENRPEGGGNFQNGASSINVSMSSEINQMAAKAVLLRHFSGTKKCFLCDIVLLGRPGPVIEDNGLFDFEPQFE